MTIESTFSGFSVDDLAAATEFYGTLLGFGITEQMGGASIALPGGGKAWLYPKSDHLPATYTMLNLVVTDIDQAVNELVAKGVNFEHYPDSYQDDKGIMRGKDHQRGPNIAWFKDPAGNILALVEA